MDATDTRANSEYVRRASILVDTFVAQQPVDLLDSVLAELAHRLGQTLAYRMHDGQRRAGEHAKRCFRKGQDSLRMKVAVVQRGDEFADVVAPQHALLGCRLPPCLLEGAIVIPILRVGNARRLRPRNNREINLRHRQTPTSTGGEIVENLEQHICSINCVSILKANMRGFLRSETPPPNAVGKRPPARPPPPASLNEGLLPAAGPHPARSVYIETRVAAIPCAYIECDNIDTPEQSNQRSRIDSRSHGAVNCATPCPGVFASSSAKFSATQVADARTPRRNYSPMLSTARPARAI